MNRNDDPGRPDAATQPPATLDISPLATVDKATKESELLRLLVQNLRDYAIFLLDAEGRVISWNKGAERIKGYLADEIIGSHFSRFYDADERHRCVPILERAASDGSTEEEGWRLRKDGSRFWASVVITALRDEEQNLLGFAKVTRDLTERRQAEHKLLIEREARARVQAVDAERRLLQAVVAGIDDGITLQDRTGKLLFANASAARIVGFPTAEALVAAPVHEVMQRFEVFSEDGRPFPADQMPSRAALQGHTGKEVLLRYVVRDSGESRWSLARALPVFDAEGRVVQAINLFRDITDSHREEGQRRFLLEAVKQFNSSLDYEATLSSVARQIVPALADWCAIDMLEGDHMKRLAVAHVDPEKIAFVEDLEHRYPSDPNAPGSPRHVLSTGQPFLMRVLPPELLRASAKSAEHLALIERLQLHSFLAVPIIAASGPLGVLTLAMAESGRVYSERDVGFAMSLADRAAASIDNASLFRETQSALAREKEARREAEQAAKFSEMFLGVLGHDLRNPLNAIGMGGQLILSTAQDERHRRTAVRIMASSQRMARMIDQLLDFTRIRLGGGLALEPSHMNLGELVREIVDETEAGQPCTIEFERDGNVVGTWDSDRLGQVLSNLLANAAQHGAGGPVRVRLDGRTESSVRLEIANQGEIPAEVLPHIFDPFRGTTYQHKASRGLGLGLYITREIVNAHGGSIEVVSREASTSFQINLPRRASPRGPARGAGKEELR